MAIAIDGTPVILVGGEVRFDWFEPVWMVDGSKSDVPVGGLAAATS